MFTACLFIIHFITVLFKPHTCTNTYIHTRTNMVVYVQIQYVEVADLNFK